MLGNVHDIIQLLIGIATLAGLIKGFTKLDEIHVLVNSRLTNALGRIRYLEKDIPEDEKYESTEKKEQ